MQLGEKVDNRSSRVVLALGNEAIAKMAKYKVGVIGLSPTGSEIIKNLILTGIGNIEINDSENLTNFDLGSNFFARDCDFDQNSPKKRIDTIPKRLGHLNRSCKVTTVSQPISDEWMSKFNSIILSEIRPFSEISRISNFCHSNNIQFIFAATVGPNAVLFEDFGDNFTCNNPNGEAPLEAHVKRIRKTKEGQSILQLDKSEIDVLFPAKSTIKFEDVAGMPQVNDKTSKVIKMIYPGNDRQQKFEGQFLIDLDTSSFGSFIGSAPIGKVIQVINPYVFNHKPISETLSNHPSNHNPAEIPVKDLFIAMSRFWDEKGRPPQLFNIEDAEYLYNQVKPEKETLQLKKSALLFSTEYPPTVGMIGGCASMECIKYCTGVALPTFSQWASIDRSCVIGWEIDELPILDGHSRYDPITATVGNKIQERMRKINALIVGVGAIGCEYARYAALFGFNRITLIDNDTVELSNLTRQFLFRDKHQGMPKATVGRISILKVNSDLKEENVVAFQEKFLDKTVLKVGRNFDVVFSAVDSAIGRNFISDYASSRRIPMVNAGMEKYRGNFNIYIPYKTQKANYKENQKNSELPCTLKTIPTTPYHLLQWAHNEFIDYFQIQPTAAIECIQKKGQILDEPRMLRDGVEFLLSKPKNFQDCIQWAYDRFTMAIEYHPMIQIENNQKVKPCPFDIKNQWHREFLLSAAFLKAKVHNYTIDEEKEAARVEELFKGCIKKPNQIDKNMSIDSEIIDTDSLLKKFQSLNFDELSQEVIIPIDFDKDSPNDVDFIEGFAKSRSEVFSIYMETFSKLKIMKVVGSISPTLATTTAVAGAGPFSGFPMLFQDERKYEYDESIEKLPFLQLAERSKKYDGQFSFRQIELSFSGQVPAKRRIKYGTISDKKFCVWDFIDVEDNPTLEELQERVKKFLRPDVDIEWMVGDKSIFYSDETKSNHIVEELRNILDYDDDYYIVDQICFSLEDDDEKIELPRLRVFVKHD